jgi:hypothetical protein
MPYSRRFVQLLVLLSVLGAFVILLSTARGVGLSPDSAIYLDTARNLLHGHGLVITFDSVAARPLTQYPPLYPALLAVGGLSGADLQDVARYLNATLFGALILLVGGAIYRQTQSLRISLVAALFVLASVGLINVYATVLSEVPFIVAGLLSLVLLSAYLEEPQVWLLVVASVAAAFSFLARYPGVSFVAAGAAGILVLRRGRLWRKVSEAAVFAAVGGLPAAAWVARNLALSHAISSNVTGAAAIPRPSLGSALTAGLRTLSTWALPSPAPYVVRLGVLALLVAGLLGLSVFALAKQRRNEDCETAPRLPGLPHLLVIFVAVYLSLIVVSILTTGQGFLDRRFLAPIYVALVMCLAALVHRLSSPMRSAPTLGASAVTTMALLAVIYCGTAAAWTLRSYVTGLGYAAKSWTESALIARVRELPDQTPIYSNAPDAVYLLTRRNCFWLPGRASPLVDGGKGPPASSSSQVVQQLRDGQPVVVFFDAVHRSGALSRRELLDAVALRPIAESSDGAMYAVQ